MMVVQQGGHLWVLLKGAPEENTPGLLAVALAVGKPPGVGNPCAEASCCGNYLRRHHAYIKNQESYVITEADNVVCNELRGE